MPGVNYLRIALLAFVVALFPLGYIKGCSDEKERFDSYKGEVAAAGKAQEERTAARIANDNMLKEEADHDHHEALRRLAAVHARALARMRADASGLIVPSVPAAPGSGAADDDVACFGAGRLNELILGSLEHFLERAADVVQRGETAEAGFQACAEWAVKEWKAPR